MGIIRGVAFWIMMAMMWLLLTPSLVNFISGMNLSGVEGFLMGVLPWVVLLALVIKVLASLQGGESPL